MVVILSLFVAQSKVANVAVGDHIASINGQDLTGCRHFEVARILKAIPIGSEFTIGAVSPQTGMQVRRNIWDVFIFFF